MIHGIAQAQRHPGALRRRSSTAGSCRGRRRPRPRLRSARPARRGRLGARVARGPGRHALAARGAALGRGGVVRRGGRARRRGVAPVCVAGFTDSHWLREAFGTVAYGFFPARAMPAERPRRLIHSADERIPVDDLELGVRWLRHAALRHARPRLVFRPWPTRRRSGSAGWRSRTACSSTGRPPGPARCGCPTGRLEVARATASASAPPRSRRRSCAARPASRELFALLPEVRRRVPGAAAAVRAARRCSAGMAASAVVVRLLRGTNKLAPGGAGARSPGCVSLAPGGDRAAPVGPRRLPRRRARLDRDVRARRGAREGARALRRPPRRPAAPDERGRRRAREPRARALPGPGAARGRGRLARRLDRDLRLDAAAPGREARAGALEARATSSSTGSPRPSPRRRSSRSRRPRSQACLALEHEHGDDRVLTERLPPEVFDLPVEKMRAGYYTDAYFNHARDTLLEDAPPAAGRDAGVPEEGRVARRDGRGDRDPQALLRTTGRA